MKNCINIFCWSIITSLFYCNVTFIIKYVIKICHLINIYYIIINTALHRYTHYFALTQYLFQRDAINYSLQRLRWYDKDFAVYRKYYIRDNVERYITTNFSFSGSDTMHHAGFGKWGRGLVGEERVIKKKRTSKRGEASSTGPKSLPVAPVHFHFFCGPPVTARHHDRENPPSNFAECSDWAIARLLPRITYVYI